MYTQNPKRRERVNSYLVNKGIVDTVEQASTIKRYGKSVGDKRATRHACENWKRFRAFIDNET